MTIHRDFEERFVRGLFNSEVFYTNMKNIVTTIIISLFCFSLWVSTSSATTDKANEITIVIPVKVVARFINDILPIEITKHKGFSGALWIQSIDTLQLGVNKALFSVKLYGENITYAGKIGSLSTSLNLGTIDIPFNCEATLSYDKEKNILHVQPNVMKKENENELLYPLLKTLLHDQAYPVEIQKLKPLITELSDKTVTIHMDISNIYTVNNRLFIGIKPTLEKNHK